MSSTTKKLLTRYDGNPITVGIPHMTGPDFRLFICQRLGLIAVQAESAVARPRSSL